MMSLLLYLMVLLVSVSSVLFGVGWLSAPEPHYQAPPPQMAHQPVPAAPKANGHLSPVYPTVSALQPAAPAKPAETSGVPPAKPSKPAVSSTPSQPVPQSAAKVETAPAGAAQRDAVAVPAPATPACDVQACAAAYYSFRASDCTYQPYDGPRRLCAKGTPPAQAQTKPGTNAAPSGIDAQAQAPACNVVACQAAYRTFNPADCTYQPYDGPRRICTK